jgi:ribosomal silencing factor RsfS
MTPDELADLIMFAVDRAMAHERDQIAALQARLDLTADQAKGLPALVERIATLEWQVRDLRDRLVQVEAERLRDPLPAVS